MHERPPPRRTLAALARGRDNHLNLLRALAAAAVIYTHAFGATGRAADEPLVALCGKSFGSVAVDVFFVVSGFLVAKSWDRSGGVLEFAVARALRIYPGLWVCVAICVAGIGAAFTSLPLAEYAASEDMVAFVLRNFTVLPFGTLGHLPGVFVGQPESTVNLPLWTLPFELKMYVLLALLGRLRWLHRRGAVASLVGTGGAVYVAHAASGAPPAPAIEYARFVYFFYAGTLAYLHRDCVPVDGRVALSLSAAVVLAAAAPWLELREPAIALATPYLVLWAALALPRALLAYNGVGDYSYGLYIYGFPVQQAVVAWGRGRATPADDLWYSLPVALLLAILSWHLVEARALAWRHALGRAGARREGELS
jgi:peptidoglycan/LPS O-acetylase OafA/YrhL